MHLVLEAFGAALSIGSEFMRPGLSNRIAHNKVLHYEQTDEDFLVDEIDHH